MKVFLSLALAAAMSVFVTGCACCGKDKAEKDASQPKQQCCKKAEGKKECKKAAGCEQKCQKAGCKKQCAKDGCKCSAECKKAAGCKKADGACPKAAGK